MKKVLEKECNWKILKHLANIQNLFDSSFLRKIMNFLNEKGAASFEN